MPSMFSKRHYEAIATILRTHKPSDGESKEAYNELVEDFIELFEVDNHLFDRGRFVDWIYKSVIRNGRVTAGTVGDARKKGD